VTGSGALESLIALIRTAYSFSKDWKDEDGARKPSWLVGSMILRVAVQIMQIPVHFLLVSVTAAIEARIPNCTSRRQKLLGSITIHFVRRYPSELCNIEITIFSRPKFREGTNSTDSPVSNDRRQPHGEKLMILHNSNGYMCTLIVLVDGRYGHLHLLCC
jgi:hypothetical protein